MGTPRDEHWRLSIELAIDSLTVITAAVMMGILLHWFLPQYKFTNNQQVSDLKSLNHVTEHRGRRQLREPLCYHRV